MTYTPEVDLSGLATKAELTEGLNGKANASTVGGLSTAVNSKASQTALDAAVTSSVTGAASATPPGLLSLLLGALSINPTPASITLHMVALEP